MTRRRAFVVALLVALSVTGSAKGAANGNLPRSELAPILSYGSCTYLRADAAAAYNTMSLAAKRPLSIQGCDSAYRTYARQVYWRNYWCGRGACGNAAVPGTSNHGWGLAVDVAADTRRTIDQIGERYGWAKRWSDAPHEWWHLAWRPGVWKPRPDPGPSVQFPILRLGSGGPGQSPSVRELQALLRKHGAKSLAIDGRFGIHVANTVKRFQVARGLKADAIVGHKTWRALRGPIVKGPPPRAPPNPPVVRAVNGVDVSVFQGSIDWKAVHRHGHEFAVAKASEGEDFRDKLFGPTRFKAIADAGLVRGAYHFLRPRAGRSGKVEATFFVQVARSAGYRARGDLRLVADLESTTLSPGATCTYLHEFSDRIVGLTGARPIIYTYVSFANSNLAGCGSWLAKHTLWIAHYVGAGHKPTVPAPWSRYRIHQYSSTGRVSGISGNVDVNVVPGGRDSLLRLRVP